jgi:alpha-glucosidase (family GH31 glycosyl hydrolase)
MAGANLILVHMSGTTIGFPTPQGLIDSLKQRGVYANLWMNPYISPERTVYKPILPYTASHTYGQA